MKNEAVVWADDVSPFTGAQVKTLLEENEQLHKTVVALENHILEQDQELASFKADTYESPSPSEPEGDWVIKMGDEYLIAQYWSLWEANLAHACRFTRDKAVAWIDGFGYQPAEDGKDAPVAVYEPIPK